MSIDWSATRWKIVKRHGLWCAIAPPESEDKSLGFVFFSNAIDYATARAYYARVRILSLEAQFVTVTPPDAAEATS